MFFVTSFSLYGCQLQAAFGHAPAQAADPSVGAFPEQGWHLFGCCKECDLIRIDDIKEKKTQTNQTKKTQQEAAGTFPSSDMCVFSLNLPLEWVSGARPKANQPLPEHPLWHPTLLGETRILLNFRRCTGTTAVLKGRWAPWHARFTPGERKSRTRKEDVSGYFCRGAVAVPAAHARSAPCQGWRMRPPC